MYTLRKITKSQKIEFNFYLGDNYSLVHRERNEQAFAQIHQQHFDEKPGDKDFQKENFVFAFVVGQDLKTHPLHADDNNYIMTESGKTFSNIKI